MIIRLGCVILILVVPCPIAEPSKADVLFTTYNLIVLGFRTLFIKHAYVSLAVKGEEKVMLIAELFTNIQEQFDTQELKLAV